MKNKNLLISGVIFIFIGLVIFGLLLLNPFSGSPTSDIDSVTVQKDGGTLTVRRGGQVTYQFGDDTFNDQWDADKTDAFFDHFENNYLVNESQLVTGGQNSVTVSIGGNNVTYILPEDELVDVVIDDTTGGGGGGGGNPTPTPTPYPTAPGQGGTPTPTPSGSSPFSNCLYWRLSYCVIPITPTPTPSGTPDPEANVIEASNCGEYLDGNLVPTIISNTLCLPTPTPTP